eukprot:3770219-Pyramimonas_sp.AAC.1
MSGRFYDESFRDDFFSNLVGVEEACPRRRRRLGSPSALRSRGRAGKGSRAFPWHRYLHSDSPLILHPQTLKVKSPNNNKTTRTRKVKGAPPK